MPVRATRSVAAALVLAAALVTVLAACAADTGPPGTCARQEPPHDPNRAISACGVAGTDLGVPIPRHADLLPVLLELYDSRSFTCVGSGPCAVGDDRDHLAAPGTDPVVDPSRRRALLTLDWADDKATLHVNPRCELPSATATAQHCTPVAASAIGFTLAADPGATAPWVFHLALDLPADPGGAPTPATSDRWDITLDPSVNRMTLTGDGSGTPDFALLSQGSVVCDAPDAPPPRPPAPEPTQHYSCAVTLPGNP